MPVMLSSGVIQAMGFRALAAGESISASFKRVLVYDARGVALKMSTVEVMDGTINGVPYRVGVGAGLNKTCMVVANDSYVDDEDRWKKEQQANGPFLLVELGPTQQYSVTLGHIKDEADGSATTYDSFPGLRDELARLEAAALPPLLTALTCTLAGPAGNVDLRRIDRTSIGRTPAGKIIRDIHLHISATGHASHAVAQGDLAIRLQDAVKLAPKLRERPARFFALGLAEDDGLKKFLYFFLALEIETHAAFVKIDHQQALTKLLSTGSAQRPSAIALLEKQTDQLRNLFDRFVWCANCAWSNVSDADIGVFKDLKEVRDAIAHGTTSHPPPGYVGQAQGLARKILSL